MLKYFIQPVQFHMFTNQNIMTVLIVYCVPKYYAYLNFSEDFYITQVEGNLVNFQSD